MKHAPEQFRIGKLAHKLGVKRFVIRFWEKEFGISAHRSSGGQRFYKVKDLETFKLIKELLYEKGFTIAGAKKILEKTTPLKQSEEHIFKPSAKTYSLDMPENITEQIKKLQKQLIKLHDLL